MEEFHLGTDIDHQFTLIKGTLGDIGISMGDIDISTTHTEVEAIEGIVIGIGKDTIEAVTIIDEVMEWTPTTQNGIKVPK